MSTRRTRGTGEIRQVGGIWKIRFTLPGGRRIQESAGPNKRDAVELLRKRLGAASEGRLHPEANRMRWDDLERIILDEHAQHRSAGKVERHVRRHLRRHFGGFKVPAITYNALLNYKHARLAEGASPSTVRYELSLARTGLVVAHKAGRLLHVPPMPRVHVENTRVSFFDDAEYQALLEHLPAAVAPVVSFLYWTGWRKNEALTREWRHVDFARGVIRLEPGETKSGKGRTFPFDVLPELAALLQAQREYTDAVERRTGSIVPHVFHRDGARIVSFRAAWKAACAKAGLVGRIPHDFRRTAVRRLERAGVPRSVAMQLVGHETDAIYRRYAITNETDLREGLAKVAQSAPSGKTARGRGSLRVSSGR